MVSLLPFLPSPPINHRHCYRGDLSKEQLGSILKRVFMVFKLKFKTCWHGPLQTWSLINEGSSWLPMFLLIFIPSFLALTHWNTHLELKRHDSFESPGSAMISFICYLYVGTCCCFCLHLTHSHFSFFKVEFSSSRKPSLISQNQNYVCMCSLAP